MSPPVYRRKQMLVLLSICRRQVPNSRPPATRAKRMPRHVRSGWQLTRAVHERVISGVRPVGNDVPDVSSERSTARVGSSSGFAPDGRWRTLTFLAALRANALIAPCVIDGPINGVICRAYVEQFLVPILRRGDPLVSTRERRPPSSRRGASGTGCTGSADAFLPPRAQQLRRCDASSKRLLLVVLTNRVALGSGCASAFPNFDWTKRHR